MARLWQIKKGYYHHKNRENGIEANQRWREIWQGVVTKEEVIVGVTPGRVTRRHQLTS